MALNKIIIKMKSINIKAIIKNIFSFMKLDIKRELRTTQQELRTTQQELRKTQEDIQYYKIINYHDNHPSHKYKEEISFLRELGNIAVFPYSQKKTIDNIEAEFDNKKNMPFVMHGKNKKLYFPKSWDVEQARATYKKFIERENILGGDYLEKSPHQYQTQNICVKEGDVVLDIGAAEGLFSLDIIDIAKKVYIFESEKIWIEPLFSTFEPYRDKVIIINKRVSNIDSSDEVRLDSCLKLDDVQSLFIKMDIDGFEKRVIEGNRSLFSKDINIRVACCTYHRHNDAEDLKLLFNNIGYKTEYSDGYMIFIYDKDMRPPYFRKGIIRAEKLRRFKQ